MSIHELPPQVANQIAAGEVVERPSAVVKELIENSFDAGATRVLVDIDQSGSSKILIRDNGSGIPHDELGLALKRHATSKISSIDDLNQLMSMGFRGEALASIAAVSRLTLTSKTKDQSMAYAVSVEGIGQVPSISPAAHPNGTSVEIRDLFFNTPARRRFLRSEKTEFMQIEEIFRRLAISRGDVALTLKHNGKVVYDLKNSDNEESYLKRLAIILGKAFINDVVKVDTSLDDIKLKGYVSLVEEKHPSQYFFVNSRIVKDKTIVHAIKEAFSTTLGKDGNVSYVCFLSIHPSEVDINVHPQKFEVRFQESRKVHDFIQNSITNGLRREEQVLPESFEETISPLSGHNYGSFKVINVNEDIQKNFVQVLDQKVASDSIHQTSMTTPIGDNRSNNASNNANYLNNTIGSNSAIATNSASNRTNSNGAQTKSNSIPAPQAGKSIYSNIFGKNYSPSKTSSPASTMKFYDSIFEKNSNTTNSSINSSNSFRNGSTTKNISETENSLASDLVSIQNKGQQELHFDNFDSTNFANNSHLENGSIKSNSTLTNNIQTNSSGEDINSNSFTALNTVDIVSNPIDKATNPTDNTTNSFELAEELDVEEQKFSNKCISNECLEPWLYGVVREQGQINILGIEQDCYALLTCFGAWYFLNVRDYSKNYFISNILNNFEMSKITTSNALLVPLEFHLQDNEREKMKLLESVGFLMSYSNNSVKLKAVPIIFRSINIMKVVEEILKRINDNTSKEDFGRIILEVLFELKAPKNFSIDMLKRMLPENVTIKDLEIMCPKCLKQINMNKIIKDLF